MELCAVSFTFQQNKNFGLEFPRVQSNGSGFIFVRAFIEASQKFVFHLSTVAPESLALRKPIYKNLEFRVETFKLKQQPESKLWELMWK